MVGEMLWVNCGRRYICGGEIVVGELLYGKFYGGIVIGERWWANCSTLSNN